MIVIEKPLLALIREGLFRGQFILVVALTFALLLAIPRSTVFRDDVFFGSGWIGEKK